MGNWISNICPAPKEPNFDNLYAILKDYTITSDEYKDIYNFLPLLNRISHCDCSDSPMDWYTIKNSLVKMHWMAFVTCRPQDMLRLKCVAKRMHLDINISDEEPDDMYLPF